MKYIMLETAAGQKLPVIFPDALTHSVVAQVMAVAVNMHASDPKIGIKARTVSAGFCNVGTDVTVHGYSESLHLESNPADAARIIIGDSVSFMPDELLKPLLDKLAGINDE